MFFDDSFAAFEPTTTERLRSTLYYTSRVPDPRLPFIRLNYRYSSRRRRRAVVNVGLGRGRGGELLQSTFVNRGLLRFTHDDIFPNLSPGPSSFRPGDESDPTSYNLIAAGRVLFFTIFCFILFFFCSAETRRRFIRARSRKHTHIYIYIDLSERVDQIF